MVERGRAKRLRREREARDRGEASTTGAVKAVISLAVDHAHEHLQAEMDAFGGRGRPAAGIAAMVDTGLDAKTICAIGLQTAFNYMARRSSCQQVVEKIGSHVEDEVRLRWLAKEAPALYRFIDKDAHSKGSTDYAHRRSVLMAAIPRLDVAETWERWDVKTRAHVGIKLLHLFAELGVFETPKVGAFKSRRVLVRLTEAAERELAQLEERLDLLARPEFRPMTAPPTDWTSPTSGGYHRIDVPLVKRSKRSDIRRLSEADMSEVYAAVNAIQRTPWAVNEDVLVVAEELWRAGTPIKGLPEAASTTEPTRPEGLPERGEELNEEQKRLLHDYKVARRAWFDEEAARSSRTVLALQTLGVASDMRGAPIYFPHQLDFRGRVYAIPTGLTPQGTDLSKGLLTFAEGRRLGTWGAFWLAVHGANSFGVDKGALSERVDWVLEHQDLILEVAADPIGNLWWTEADSGQSPFQFLAFCFEWAGYVESGESEDFVSHLPVGVDGSCNGLQHYSAILRDPVGAHAVNLTASKEQQDIYTRVAEVTERLVREKAGESEADREFAGMWLAHGVTRKVVKRSVMTTPYGVTTRGIGDHIFADTVKGSDVDFGPRPWEAASWLAALVIEAIGSTVAAAEDGMRFLREMVKATNKRQQGIAWVTPAGFPVMQESPDFSKVRISTKLLGNVTLQFRAGANGKVDKRKQSTGIAPNFIHSMDAAHLMLTVNAYERGHGSTSWMMIHDSFGTHAGGLQDLGITLREEFVGMYEDHCPLQALRDTVITATGIEDVEPVPARGRFDLNEVLKAEFFFA